MSRQAQQVFTLMTRLRDLRNDMEIVIAEADDTPDEEGADALEALVSFLEEVLVSARAAL